MIAIANPDPGELNLEESKADIVMVRSLARRGLLSPQSIQDCATRLEKVATEGKEERMRVAADKALVAMQVALLKLLHDTHRGVGGDSAQVTNQQINIYLPANGRETQVLPSVNGNGNGKH